MRKPSNVDALSRAYVEGVTPFTIHFSVSGFYIGGRPLGNGAALRLSKEYFDTEEEANRALNTGEWTQKALS